MEKNKVVLIGIAFLVILLAIFLVALTSNSNSDIANATVNITDNTTDSVNVTNDAVNTTQSSVNNSSSLPNSADLNTGWRWSEQAQTYVRDFVDGEGDLHHQYITGNGKINDLEYRHNGDVFLNGKNVTAAYYTNA